MSGNQNAQKIVPVILAGGNGTRLWPVSRPDVPKQFHKLIENKTLYESTLNRVCKNPLYAPAIVLLNEEHQFLAQQISKNLNNLNGIQYIFEPIIRNTAPAILLAALKIAETDPNAQLLVLPSDHRITDERAFENAIRKASSLASKTRNLITFGINPTRAESGYGYIETGAPIQGGGLKVTGFHEKPHPETAARYILEGCYLWNSGMFLFPAQTLLSEFAKHQPEILKATQAAFEKAIIRDGNLFPNRDQFNKVNSISIDHAIMEKTELSSVIPVDAIWNDLGSWHSILENSKLDANGNNIEGNALTLDTKNSLVRSTGPLTTVIGLDNIIVITEPDAVLVTSKSSDQKVKDLIVRLKKAKAKEIVAHAHVQRPWGSFTSIESGQAYQVKHITVASGEKLSLQSHKKRSEHWIVVSGTANVEIDDENFSLSPGSSVFIPIEAKHRLENNGKKPLELIEIQCGSYLGEDDIIRYDDIYGRNISQLSPINGNKNKENSNV